MSVHVTESTMISDRSPETARRVHPDGPAPWRLSWWPGEPLTRERALAGMELDELISDPANVRDPLALARMQERADRLGLVFAQAVLMLAKRMAARLAAAGELDPPAGPAPPGPDPRHPRGGDIGVPRGPEPDAGGCGLQRIGGHPAEPPAPGP